MPGTATLSVDADRSGLSSVVAADRLLRDGPNELPRADRRSVLRLALDVLREPMLALLLAGGVAYAPPLQQQRGRSYERC